MKNKSLQEIYAPNSICYGCGPANPKGLQIESFVQDDQVITHWQPPPHLHAFDHVLCGGAIGTVMDCHSNWAAAWYLMHALKLDKLPCTVTAEYSIKLLKPTPMNNPLKITAILDHIKDNRALIRAELIADDKICDTCQGLFVAVSEGHPAYHRW